MARCRDARSYGTLLIEIGQRASGVPVPIAAFSHPSSFLERRIRAMFDRKPRGWRVLAGGSALVAVLLVAFACEVPRPTMAQAAGAGDALPRPLALQASDTLVLYLEDSVMRLRVRTPEEEDIPEPAPAVCADPIGGNDMGGLRWPGCGGYKLYHDGSVLLARVHPFVEEMVVGGPAWRAGLRSGDVILSVDGHDTRSFVGPFLTLRDPREHSPDEPYRVRVRRGAEELELGFPVH
jgi:hypothetical protein